MHSVKIAIDIRRMTEFGVGTYIRNVVRTLGRVDHETHLFSDWSSRQDPRDWSAPAEFSNGSAARPERSIKGYREFRIALKRLDCDLVHIPNLFSVPRFLPCPYVMTVHDLVEHMSRARQQTGFWGAWHLQMTKRVLRGAARVFAVSNFTRTEIEKLFNIPTNRIEVVYNAIDERFLHGHANPADRQLIAQRYQVNYPFLLYAGRISPHKNVVRMIEAFSALKTELEKDQLYPDLKLIIIGDDVSGNPDLRRTVVRSGVQNDVRFLGSFRLKCCEFFTTKRRYLSFRRCMKGSDFHR